MDEMYKLAGKRTIRRMTEIFGSRENARDWFYSPLLGLGFKSPYDYYKEGKSSKVKDLIKRLEYGIYS